MSNDAEVRAREVLADIVGDSAAWTAKNIRKGTDAGGALPVSTADALKAMIAFAAEARSHDGEWEAMREAENLIRELLPATEAAYHFERGQVLTGAACRDPVNKARRRAETWLAKVVSPTSV